MNRRSQLFRIVAVIGLNLGLIVILSLMVGVQVKADTPIYVRPGGDDTLCDGTVNEDYPPTNPNPEPPHPCAVQTIQRGVDLVDAGGTVLVAVGYYTETVTINKALSLLGAQAGVQPTSAAARPGGESTLRTNVSSPYRSNLITVLVDGVTISGFMLDGNNPVLGPNTEFSNGVYLHVAGGIANGVDSDGTNPSDYSHPIDNATISHNIIKNVNHHGVALLSGVASAHGDNMISENFFDNIQGTTVTGSYIHRRGIWLGLNHYASVIDNQFTRVRWGINVNQFTSANPGAATTISGNIVACNTSCVRLGSFSASSSPYTVISNTISGASQEGLALSSLNSTQQFTIANNSITGNGRGIVFSGSSPVIIQDNYLSCNTTLALNNEAGGYDLNASGNWWGSSTPSSSISGSVDYTPWLNSGTNNSTGAGFLGDFSSLTVDDLANQTGTLEPIEEGLDIVTPGGTLYISAGSYNEGITLDQDTDILVNGDISLAGGLAIQQNSFTAPSGSLSLTGDFLLSGGTFDSNGGTLSMDGSSAQTIGGTASTILSSLTINNSTGVSLGIDEQVDGTLTLSAGRFSLGASTLTMGTAANVAGTFSASNMIVADSTGKLCKQFGDVGSFFYPVGDQTGSAEYSPASVTFTSGIVAAGGQACVNLRNEKLPGHNTPNHITRYWTIDSSAISDFQADVTFNYVDADVVGVESLMFTSKKDGTVWSAGNAADTENNELSMDAITSFSDFTGKSDPTAVTLSSFEITGHNGFVMIRWSTLLELDILGYNIHRSTSLDGDLERVNPDLVPVMVGGFPGGVYDYMDTSVQLGETYYYWLEVVGINGNELLAGPIPTTIYEYIYLPVVTR